eukprot:GHVU01173937.1.p2 GENE.GHVU01173937.1~~GHVU01173937.1.p2  ORF type:complete len:101 (-),score=1.05 GHVU01173937.1:1735-2037(-)
MKNKECSHRSSVITAIHPSIHASSHSNAYLNPRRFDGSVHSFIHHSAHLPICTITITALAITVVTSPTQAGTETAALSAMPARAISVPSTHDPHAAARNA